MKNANIVSISTTSHNDQPSASDLIPGTDWTYGEAASMHKEITREKRLFGGRVSAPRKPRLSVAQRAARRAAKFLAETGMTLEDAASMAKEAMREHRLFGPSFYAQV
jgi:hypothetical protein